MRLLGLANADERAPKNIPVYELSSGIVFFVGDLDVCWDGSGPNTKGDRTFLADTAYHYQGKALDATHANYVVVPQLILQHVKGIVLGSLARVTDLLTGKTVQGVCGDYGGLLRVGEVSACMCDALGISDDPNSGGSDDVRFAYEIWPGVAATTPEGALYTLQPWRH